MTCAPVDCSLVSDCPWYNGYANSEAEQTGLSLTVANRFFHGATYHERMKLLFRLIESGIIPNIENVSINSKIKRKNINPALNL